MTNMNELKIRNQKVAGETYVTKCNKMSMKPNKKPKPLT